MAHANGKIYVDHSVDPPSGIDPLGDVGAVLQRSTGDLGQLCGDIDKDGNDVNKVNIHSVHKPVRSTLLGGTEQEIKVPAKYGFQVDAKAAGSSTLSFVQQLRNQGASYAHWTWNKPRGESRSPKEHYRIMDFEGYNHNQLPYRTPVYFNRLTAMPVKDGDGNDIEGTSVDVVLPKQQTTTDVIETGTFRLTDAYDVSVVVYIVVPNPELFIDNTNMNWNVDGDFQVQLVDANGRIVDSDYSTGFGVLTHNIPQKLVFHFENFHSLEGYTQPFFIRYRLHMANNSYYFNNVEEEYQDVTVRIETTYASTLSMSYTGKDGVVVRPSGLSSEWIANGYLARETVFGANGAWPIVCIEVTNGSITQRKLALVPSSGFIPFKRVGITIQPGSNETDIIVYLLYGNYQQIFTRVQDGIDYGDLSLADAWVLTTAPNCYNALGAMPEPPPPMIVHQDDFNSGTITWHDNTTTALHAPNQYGLVTSSKGIKVFDLTWAFYIENVPVSLPVTITMNVYNGGDDELVESVVREYTASIGDWSALVNFVADNAIAGYMVDEVYIKINIDANGDVYYLDILHAALSKADPGPFYIGTNPS